MVIYQERGEILHGYVCLRYSTYQTGNWPKSVKQILLVKNFQLHSEQIEFVKLRDSENRNVLNWGLVVCRAPLKFILFGYNHPPRMLAPHHQDDIFILFPKPPSLFWPLRPLALPLQRARPPQPCAFALLRPLPFLLPSGRGLPFPFLFVELRLARLFVLGRLSECGNSAAWRIEWQ